MYKIKIKLSFKNFFLGGGIEIGKMDWKIWVGKTVIQS